MQLIIIAVKEEHDADDATFTFTDSDGNSHTLNFSDSGRVMIPAEHLPQH